MRRNVLRFDGGNGPAQPCADARMKSAGMASARQCGRICAFAIALAVVSGCATDHSVGVVSVPSAAASAGMAPVAPDDRATDQLLRFVAKAGIGESAIVPNPAGSRLRVTVEKEYFSAAGFVCRRFSVAPAASLAGGGAKIRVACAEPDGWRLDPVAVGQGMRLIER